MKVFFTKTSIWSVVCAALLWSGYSQAAVVKVRGERAGHWDASFMLNYVEGESQGTENDPYNQGYSKVDNNMGWGLGFHYNFNAHWNLGFDMAFNNPDYKAQVSTVSPVTGELEYSYVDHTANRFDGQINGQYNLLSGSFTPYVQAGLGWTYMDSNIVSSLSTYCSGFYYPYCRTYANTYDDTSFSYNLGVGLRWDVSDAIFLKVAYIQQWVDNSDSTSPQTGRAEIGFMF